VLWVVVYWMLRYLETTIAGAFLRTIGFVGVIVIICAFFLFQHFGLDILKEILTWVIFGAFISVVIIFQPELRHGLTRLGHSTFARLLRRWLSKVDERGSSIVDEIMKAARRFSKNRVGSLVVIEREVSLQPYVDRAVRVDAAVKAELLDTIFTTPTLLHDGAVIIRNDRIEAAGAVLPLTQNPDVPKRYGTRHRAAIGITEESDAVVVVTSEETGTISLVWNGQIRAQEDTVKAEETLERLLGGEEIRDGDEPTPVPVSVAPPAPKPAAPAPASQEVLRS
jgi:diadenylate cyclase